MVKPSTRLDSTEMQRCRMIKIPMKKVKRNYHHPDGLDYRILECGHHVLAKSKPKSIAKQECLSCWGIKNSRLFRNGKHPLQSEFEAIENKYRAGSMV